MSGKSEFCNAGAIEQRLLRWLSGRVASDIQAVSHLTDMARSAIAGPFTPLNERCWAN